MNSSIIYNIGCSGNIVGSVAGGIVGDTGWGLIKECFNSSSVYGYNNFGYGDSTSGGITNSEYEYGKIIILDSYNIGNIKLLNSGVVGGLVGIMDSPITCTNVYNIGELDSNGKNVGNIIGKTDLYREEPILEGCYHLANGLATVGNIEELTKEQYIKTTEEMKIKSTYSEFDFEGKWEIVENKFPTLKGSNHIFLSQIESEDINIKINQAKEIEFKFVPEIVDDTVFSYSIEDEEIATINDNGKIVGKKPGQTKIKISSLYEDISKVINITVEEKVLESIDITTKPNKTSYKKGENFESNGIVVTATYDDGSTEQITDYTVIGGSNLNCLVKKVEIQSNENPKIKTELPIVVEHDMINATCTDEGKCKVEGCIYREEALGHSFINYVSNNDATCIEDGTETAKCDRCEEKHTRTEAESAKGHTEVDVIGTVPTCTETGLTQGKYCSECKVVIVEQKEIPALGHNFTNYVSNNDATCTQDGSKTAKCERCEETDTIVDEGSKLSHNYENGKCTGCGQEELKTTITSEKYTISEEYITKITDKTTLNAFKEAISANAEEIKIVNKDNQELTSEDIIGTGMILILKSKAETRQFKLVISGDATGDGKADFKDIVLINRYRLHKTTLEEEYLMAGEVTGDEKVDFKDIVRINRFRLNKITEL